MEKIKFNQLIKEIKPIKVHLKWDFYNGKIYGFLQDTLFEALGETGYYLQIPLTIRAYDYDIEHADIEVENIYLCRGIRMSLTDEQETLLFEKVNEAIRIIIYKNTFIYDWNNFCLSLVNYFREKGKLKKK